MMVRRRFVLRFRPSSFHQSHGCLMLKPKRVRPAFKAMIVAPQSEATEAGLSVVEPMMCGIGGIGILHLYDPASGKNLVLDGSSTCPAASRPEQWTALFERECPDGYGYVLRGAVNELGHAAVATPGIMRVFGEAHAGFGRLPWAELFGPAVGLAETGWLVRPHVATMFGLDEAAY